MSDWQVDLEFQEGNSSKFWRARVDGNQLFVNYGRIGSNGQTQVKDLASPEAARKELDKLEREKRRKGYEDAGSAPDEDDEDDEDDDADEPDDAADDDAAADDDDDDDEDEDGDADDAAAGADQQARLVLDRGGRKIATQVSLTGTRVHLDAVETHASPEAAQRAYQRLLAALAADGHGEG